jgi:hypothetical protein
MSSSASCSWQQNWTRLPLSYSFNTCSRWLLYGSIDRFLRTTFHTVVTGIWTHGMLYAMISSGSSRMSLWLAGCFLHSHQDGHSSAGTGNPWIRIFFMLIVNCLPAWCLFTIGSPDFRWTFVAHLLLSNANTKKALSGPEVAIFASNANCRRMTQLRDLAVKSEKKNLSFSFTWYA